MSVAVDTAAADMVAGRIELVLAVAAAAAKTAADAALVGGRNWG